MQCQPGRAACLDQFWQRRLAQIDVEEPAIVLARHALDDPLIVGGRRVARREIARPRVEPAVDDQPRHIAKRAVADQGPQAVEHPRALVIDVLAGAALADLVHLFLGADLAGDDGAEVGDLVTLVGEHRRIARLALAPAAVERLHVAAIAFVQPVIVPIGGGQLIAEEFVREFVLEQPVEAFGRLGIAITVSVDRLVLHALVRRLDHAELLVAERVGADFALEEIERRREFGEQRLGLGLFAGEIPIGHRDRVAVAALVAARNLLERPDRQRDAIGVGVLDPPVPCRAPIGERVDPEQHAVRRRLQALGHGDVERHEARLAGREIEARPEQVAPGALCGRAEPRRAARRLRPDDAGVPRCIDRDVRRAAIGQLGGDVSARRDHAWQRDDELALGIAPGRWRKRCAVDRYRIDRQVAVEIEHEPGERRLGGEAQRRDAAQRLGLGQHFEREVGGVEAELGLLGIDRPARFLRLCGQRRLALGRQGGGGQREAARQERDTNRDHAGLSSTEKSVIVRRSDGRPSCSIVVTRGKRTPCAFTLPAKLKCWRIAGAPGSGAVST